MLISPETQRINRVNPTNAITKTVNIPTPARPAIPNVPATPKSMQAAERARTIVEIATAAVIAPSTCPVLERRRPSITPKPLARAPRIATDNIASGAIFPANCSSKQAPVIAPRRMDTPITNGRTDLGSVIPLNFPTTAVRPAAITARSPTVMDIFLIFLFPKVAFESNITQAEIAPRRMDTDRASVIAPPGFSMFPNAAIIPPIMNATVVNIIMLSIILSNDLFAKVDLDRTTTHWLITYNNRETDPARTIAPIGF